MTERERKEMFVARINDALIECGAGCYDRLVDNPMAYIDNGGGDEVIAVGNLRISVGRDSLATMLIAIGGVLG